MSSFWGLAALPLSIYMDKQVYLPHFTGGHLRIDDRGLAVQVKSLHREMCEYHTVFIFYFSSCTFKKKTKKTSSLAFRQSILSHIALCQSHLPSHKPAYKTAQPGSNYTFFLNHKHYWSFLRSCVIPASKWHVDICVIINSFFFLILWAFTGENPGKSHFLLRWIQIPYTADCNLIPLEDSI